MKFISLDLTSAFAQHPRAIDIAVLHDDNLTFHTMNWPPAPTVTGRDGQALFLAISQASHLQPGENFKIALDGPQGLSEPGETMRTCERELGTNGHTPDHLPPPAENAGCHMGGYLRSSIDLFAALADVNGLTLCGLDPNLTLAANLFEIFPGAEWTVLARRRLVTKTTDEGRSQRRLLLEAAGVKYPTNITLPSADQNDAAVGAYLLRCCDVAQNRIRLVGASPRHDGQNLREGLILHAREPIDNFVLPITADGLEPTELPNQATIQDLPQDWTDQPLATLLLKDYGLVWGNEPENAWLQPQKDYACTAIHDGNQVEFQLTYTPDVTAAHAWRAAPTVRNILLGLGFPTPPHLTRQIAVAIQVVALAI